MQSINMMQGEKITYYIFQLVFGIEKYKRRKTDFQHTKICFSEEVKIIMV